MMTTPGPLPDRTDPAHVLAVTTEAIPGPDRDAVQLALGRPGTFLDLPTRRAARAAQDALILVGYRAGPAGRDRSLLISGWGTGTLEARLVAMRAVLSLLRAQPGRTAATMLDQLRAVPDAQLAAAETRQQATAQASQQLRRWLAARSGIHAPHDPRFQPGDAGDAMRLLAAWRLEAAIDDVAARQQRVAADALGLYPALRADHGHAIARDTAVRQASIAFHLSSPAAQDTASPRRNDGPAAGAAPAPPSPRPFPEISPGLRPGSQGAREFPGASRGVPPASLPPGSGPDRPPSRNIPSSRPGRHP
jgi:hypothetical protein